MIKIKHLHATGGGAHKFNQFISDEFKITLEKHDELLSLVSGYIAINEKGSKIFYELDSDNKPIYIPKEDLEYPHIAVNIGSGVSILKVSSLSEVKRVSGTLMGGGTLIGLSKLLTGIDNYNDIMRMAELGDNCSVDLLVKDIYAGDKSGKHFVSKNLDSDTIASSFGKIHQILRSDGKDSIKKEDICKSLLLMICYHIGQIAYIVAQENNIMK